MPQRKYRVPETEQDAHVLPRPADKGDAFVASPVHGMQRNLWSFAQNQPEKPVVRYPGWIRLTLPLALSGILWVLIFWALGYLRWW